MLPIIVLLGLTGNAICVFVRQERAAVSDTVALLCRRRPTLQLCVNRRDFVTETRAPPSSFTEAAVLNQESTQRTTPSTDWTPLCLEYQQHFFHYCFNIRQHPKELQRSLQEQCPNYYRHCPEFIRQGSSQVSGGEWFPDVPTTTREPLEQCAWHCTKAHCTEECKCRHNWPLTNTQCGFSLIANLCQAYHFRCGKFGFTINNDAHEAAQRVAAVNSGLPPEESNNPHNRNHHAQFWRNTGSAHTDWLHGNVRTGTDFGVPAIGLGGTAGNTNVKFPSVGSLFGIPNPHGPVRRRK